MGQLPVTAVVFDLGGVVLDWNPRHLYRQVFAESEDVDYFLREICTLEWHAQHDQGRAMNETIPILSAQHPDTRAPSPHGASATSTWSTATSTACPNSSTNWKSQVCHVSR